MCKEGLGNSVKGVLFCFDGQTFCGPHGLNRQLVSMILVAACFVVSFARVSRLYLGRGGIIMAALTIPQQQRLGLARLRALEDADVVKIVEAFRSMPKTEMKRKTLVPAVAEALPKLPADDIANIANTLTSLYYVRANADVPLASFAVDVCEALRDLGGQQFKFTDQEFAQFQGRLVKLLDVDPLALGAKTWALRADYENTFFEAKTLTDIRPVFGSSVEDSPVGFVLTH